MQQSCPRCGYVSDRPWRFCRQCGAPQVIETEATSAQTRNYESRPTPPPSYSTPQPSMGSGYPDSTPDTMRFYQPPPVQNYPPYRLEPQKKSRAGLWILLAFLTLFLVAGGLIGLATFALRSGKRPSTQPPVPEDIGKPGIGAPAPPAPPAPPSGPPAPSADLGKYSYPNATIGRRVRAVGNEILEMRTGDSYKQVKEFYRKLIGEPLVEVNDKEKLIFQSSGPPGVLISIEPDKAHDGQIQITVMRPSIGLPDMR